MALHSSRTTCARTFIILLFSSPCRVQTWRCSHFLQVNSVYKVLLVYPMAATTDYSFRFFNKFGHLIIDRNIDQCLTPTGRLLVSPILEKLYQVFLQIGSFKPKGSLTDSSHPSAHCIRHSIFLLYSQHLIYSSQVKQVSIHFLFALGFAEEFYGLGSGA